MRTAFIPILLLATAGIAVWRLWPDPVEPAPENFVPAWTGARISEPPGMTILRLAGTPRQRGRAHGERLKDRIRAWYERTRPRDTGTEDLYVETLGPRAAQILPAALREELEGIAEGAGLSFQKVWYLNLRFDLRAFEAPGFGRAAAVASAGEVVRRFEPADLDGWARELVVFVHLDESPLVMVGLPGMVGGFLGTRRLRAATLRPVQEAPTPVLTGLAWPLLLRLQLEQGRIQSLPAPATLDASLPLVLEEGAVGTFDISPRGATWHPVAGDFALARPEPLSTEPELDEARQRLGAERARRVLAEKPPDHLISVRLKAARRGVRVTIHRDGARFAQVIRFAD